MRGARLLLASRISHLASRVSLLASPCSRLPARVSLLGDRPPRWHKGVPTPQRGEIRKPRVTPWVLGAKKNLALPRREAKHQAPPAKARQTPRSSPRAKAQKRGWSVSLQTVGGASRSHSPGPQPSPSKAPGPNHQAKNPNASHQPPKAKDDAWPSPSNRCFLRLSAFPLFSRPSRSSTPISGRPRTPDGSRLAPPDICLHGQKSP